MIESFAMAIDSNHFQMTLDGSSFRGEYDQCFCRQSELDELLCELSRFWTAETILKEGDRTRVSRVFWKNHDMVVKHYLYRNLWYSLRGILRTTRAHRCWTTARKLIEMGISTPKPLVYVEYCFQGLVWESFLVTQYIPGVNLSVFMKELTATQEVDVVTQLGDLLEALSCHGIIHGDLKATNICVAEGGMFLTDLDSVIFYGLGPGYPSKRAKDHARLARDLGQNMKVLFEALQRERFA